FEVVRAQDRAERTLQVMLVIDFSNGADAILATGGIADVRALAGCDERQHVQERHDEAEVDRVVPRGPSQRPR
ncbi:MAG: hypothetical protein ACREXP_20945, partial [Steroidobacteraceae bacterium]